jgi:hypothetical protein
VGYIYMDESGDLGFDFSKDGTSDCFVITFLFVKDKRPVEKIVELIKAKIVEENPLFA